MLICGWSLSPTSCTRAHVGAGGDVVLARGDGAVAALGLARRRRAVLLDELGARRPEHLFRVLLRVGHAPRLLAVRLEARAPRAARDGGRREVTARSERPIVHATCVIVPVTLR